jgi:hypothetical protein
MQVYLVEWGCASGGQRHSFRHGIQEGDGWPNKFELTCDNATCGQEQNVPFRLCTVTSPGEA